MHGKLVCFVIVVSFYYSFVNSTLFCSNRRIEEIKLAYKNEIANKAQDLKHIFKLFQRHTTVVKHKLVQLETQIQEAIAFARDKGFNVSKCLNFAYINNLPNQVGELTEDYYEEIVKRTYVLSSFYIYATEIDKCATSYKLCSLIESCAHAVINKFNSGIPENYIPILERFSRNHAKFIIEFIDSEINAIKKKSLKCYLGYLLSKISSTKPLSTSTSAAPGFGSIALEKETPAPQAAVIMEQTIINASSSPGPETEINTTPAIVPETTSGFVVIIELEEVLPVDTVTSNVTTSSPVEKTDFDIEISTILPLTTVGSPMLTTELKIETTPAPTIEITYNSVEMTKYADATAAESPTETTKCEEETSTTAAIESTESHFETTEREDETFTPVVTTEHESTNAYSETTQRESATVEATVEITNSPVETTEHEKETSIAPTPAIELTNTLSEAAEHEVESSAPADEITNDSTETTEREEATSTTTTSEIENTNGPVGTSEHEIEEFVPTTECTKIPVETTEFEEETSTTTASTVEITNNPVEMTEHEKETSTTAEPAIESTGSPSETTEREKEVSITTAPAMEITNSVFETSEHEKETSAPIVDIVNTETTERKEETSYTPASALENANSISVPTIEGTKSPVKDETSTTAAPVIEYLSSSSETTEFEEQITITPAIESTHGPVETTEHDSASTAELINSPAESIEHEKEASTAAVPAVEIINSLAETTKLEEDTIAPAIEIINSPVETSEDRKEIEIPSNPVAITEMSVPAAFAIEITNSPNPEPVPQTASTMNIETELSNFWDQQDGLQQVHLNIN